MITFLLSRWRIILPIIIISVMSLSILYYKTRYERTVQELGAFKADIAKQVAMKEAENATLRRIAQSQVANIIKTHNTQLDTIKAEYEKRNKVNVNTIANLRDELRDKVRADSFTLRETPTNPDATTQEWRDSHRAITAQYQTLKDACSVTTLDYNALRDWADNACVIVGCE